MLDEKHERLSVDGKTFNLTRSEWTVLEVLRARFGRTVGEEFILECLYGWAADRPESKIIPVYIHHIRFCLRDSGFGIYNRRGFGYRLDFEEQGGVQRARSSENRRKAKG
jgi:DNA-binding response OmpR family regulator